jgi:hypothetical protein
MAKKEWIKGNRAFYWTPDYGDTDNCVKRKHPLCLQSKEFNREMKGRTWVYYSEKDARELLKFLKSVLEKIFNYGKNSTEPKSKQ